MKSASGAARQPYIMCGPGDHLGDVVHPPAHRCTRKATRVAMTSPTSSTMQERPTPHREGFTGVLVDDVQRLELAAVAGGVEPEVEGPHRVRVQGTDLESPRCGPMTVSAGPCDGALPHAAGAGCACGSHSSMGSSCRG